jgi:transposase
MVTDQQVLALWKNYKKTHKIGRSALKAGMNRKTAARYIKSNTLPSENKKEHLWQTHPDKIAPIWTEAVEFLKSSPDLEAKALFEHLLETHPNKLHESQLRTFQRRVKLWRLEFGKDQEVYFDQKTTPGKLAQMDWIVMNALGITISGTPYKHKLIHFTLNHSNVESVSVCRSESILSIKRGLRVFLYKVCGGAPQVLQVDNSSAATHRPQKDKSKRVFNDEYLHILNYYGIKAQKTNIRSPNENGVVESQNGHLKKRIKQALLLRGSSDFASVTDYEVFLQKLIEKFNCKRKVKFNEDAQRLLKIPTSPLPEYQEEYVHVRSRSTINIKKVTYSVPSRLIGSKLKAKIFDEKIELYSGQKCIYTMPRALGDRGCIIDYRHIIHSLIRKPGAFENYKYKEELYPTNNFKRAYEHLCHHKTERESTLEYLRILKLSADNIEEDVDTALGMILEDPSASLSIDFLSDLILTKKVSNLDNIVLIPNLNIYDQLLLDLGEENANNYH